MRGTAGTWAWELYGKKTICSFFLFFITFILCAAIDSRTLLLLFLFFYTFHPPPFCCCCCRPVGAVCIYEIDAIAVISYERIEFYILVLLKKKLPITILLFPPSSCREREEKKRKKWERLTIWMWESTKPTPPPLTILVDYWLSPPSPDGFTTRYTHTYGCTEADIGIQLYIEGLVLHHHSL